MYNFDVEQPTSIADAVQAMQREEAQPISGGQTLIPTLKARLAAPSVLVSLTGIDEMKGVRVADDGRLCIGGGTPHGVVAAEAEAHFPALANLAARIGDPAGHHWRVHRQQRPVGVLPRRCVGNGCDDCDKQPRDRRR